MRWLAASAVLLAAPIATSWMGLGIPAAPLYVTGLGLLAYNLLFYEALAWMHRRALSDLVYEWFARFQILLDWLGMIVLIHCSGGVESPLIIFFMFHITIASLLLPHDKGFLYVALAPALLGGLAFAEYHGLLPHVSLFGVALHRHGLYLAGVLFFFTCAAYAMAYLAMTISRRLRRRENELAALYESVEATTSTLDLKEVLSRLTEATATVLGCRAASIRLLDKTGTHLELVAAHGLSHAYMDQPPIPIGRALIDREALSGKTLLVLDAAHDPRIVYPDKVRAEGITTMLVAPLVGKAGAIGALRAYGGGGHRFARDDEPFLSAVAAHGAVAIEHARAYSLLTDLDRQRSEFVRIITHELRSPLQVTQSLLGVLSEGYLGEPSAKQAELIERARRRMQFLETLVDDLLDLAAGRAEVLGARSKGPVPIFDVLHEVHERFEPAARAKGLSLTLECADRTLAVWGDAADLDRLVNNLVSNAVKYTPQGAVHVSAAREEHTLRLEVRDTGIGIPEEARAQVFREFFRAQNAKALEERGTGLGLAIVKDVVDRYGGRLELRSVEGQGTTFVVHLPLVEQQPART